MITIELLQNFCGTDDARVGIHKPFTQSGYTWATDGRIAVRVPAMESVPKNPLAPKNTAYVFKPFNAEKCIAAIPAFPAVKLVACSSCGGTGEEDDGSECWNCEGDPLSEKAEPVQCGTRKLSNILLAKMEKLPGLLIQIDGDKLSPCSFTFDGGCGIVMPMRIHEE